MQVRPAAPGDLSAVQAIYAHHVLHGLATFEEAAPDVEEMRRRHDEVTSRGLPWLAADFGGIVAGYAYCALYRTRSAYRYTVEDSVYVREDYQGRGVGAALLDVLIERCTALGMRAVADDGFLRVGTLRSVGFKFGRWVDSVLMQKPLGPGDASRPS